MEKRIVELEKKMAFLEHTLESLNHVILGQDKKIEKMAVQLKIVQKRISDESGVRRLEEEDPPPHY